MSAAATAGQIMCQGARSRARSRALPGVFSMGRRLPTSAFAFTLLHTKMLRLVLYLYVTVQSSFENHESGARTVSNRR